MKTRISLILIFFLCILAAIAVDASTVIFEAGPFAIIMDKDMEIMEIGGAEMWNTIGFEPITSRELAKKNYYDLKIGSAIVDGEYGVVGKYPMIVEVSDEPIDDMLLFTPESVRNITMGKINPINTTLYTGTTSNELTPYFVNFTSDGIYCTVYDPNTSESTITEFLTGFSVIRKADLEKYDLSKLWSES